MVMTTWLGLGRRILLPTAVCSPHEWGCVLHELADSPSSTIRSSPRAAHPTLAGWPRKGRLRNLRGAWPVVNGPFLAEASSPVRDALRREWASSVPWGQRAATLLAQYSEDCVPQSVATSFDVRRWSTGEFSRTAAEPTNSTAWQECGLHHVRTNERVTKRCPDCRCRPPKLCTLRRRSCAVSHGLSFVSSAVNSAVPEHSVGDTLLPRHGGTERLGADARSLRRAYRPWRIRLHIICLSRQAGWPASGALLLGTRAALTCHNALQSDADLALEQAVPSRRRSQQSARSRVLGGTISDGPDWLSLASAGAASEQEHPEVRGVAVRQTVPVHGPAGFRPSRFVGHHGDEVSLATLHTAVGARVCQSTIPGDAFTS
jgi:hypothetical protein